MSPEIWAAIPTYEGQYEISYCGTVRHAVSGRPVATKRGTAGESVVLLGNPVLQEESTWQIRELMMMTFGPPKPDGTVAIGHHDGDPHNCNAGNLEWVDAWRLALVEELGYYLARLRVSGKVGGPSLGKSREIAVWRKLFQAGKFDDAVEELRVRCTANAAGCWMWPDLDEHGYPVNAIHRFALECRLGARLGSQSAHHKCANPGCVNPHHLAPATHLENVGEMFARKAFLRRIIELEEGLAAIVPNHALLKVVQVGTDEERAEALSDRDEHSETAAQLARERMKSPPPASEGTQDHAEPQKANEPPRSLDGAWTS